MEKISLPKGTRDFGPEIMAKRQFIIDSIKKVFQRYGFQPLETPAMENLSTLQGKYGDEGDQLLFRILDSGEYFNKMKLELKNSQRIAKLKDALFDSLRFISKDIFNEIPKNEGRDFDQIQKLYELVYSRESWVGARQLDAYDKELFRVFFEEEKQFLVYHLLQFFYEAGIRPENFEEKFEHHFRQFRDHILNKRLFPRLLDFYSSKEITPEISEKGLRYDLTVPFARYVVMNRHEIVFPFKRYQIQPVWRADRPQKGRYREFYQCDADVVGTDSLVCETEIILMIKDAFKALGISDYTIKINHRGILSGLAGLINAGGNESSLFVAIDKLDKIGEDKVKEELKQRGFVEEDLPKLFEILNYKGTTKQKIDFLSQKFIHSEKGQKGILDFKEVLSLLNNFGSTDEHVEFDIALARGLSYYTGCIFEVKINNVAIGSVSGGGRYDNLTAVFDAKEKSSGVGFSFGIDRLYDAMEELQVFPKETSAASTLLIAHLDEEGFKYAIKTAQAFRDKDISCEIYPDRTKIKKQMEYADRKKIPFVVIIGSEEVQSEVLTLKKMETGNQLKLSFEEIATAIQLYTRG